MDQRELDDLGRLSTAEKLIALFTLMDVVHKQQEAQGNKLDKLHLEVAEARDVIGLVREMRREVMLWAAGSLLGGGILGAAANWILANGTDL